MEDSLLETGRAVSVVETIISQFSERKYLITEYHEHWKVHISTGKEFLTQWHQFVQDARKVGSSGHTQDVGKGWVLHCVLSLFCGHSICKKIEI